MYSRLQNLQNSGRLFDSVSGSILAIFLLQNGQVTLPFSAGNIIPERVLTCKKNHPLPKDNILTKSEKFYKSQRFRRALIPLFRMVCGLAARYLM